MDKRGVPSFVWYLFAGVFSLAVLGAGAFLVAQPPHNNWAMLAAGCVCLVAVVVCWPLSAGRAAAALPPQEEAFAPINDRLDQIALLLNLISEQGQLSDRAKSVAFREKDREALRRAVQEDMGRHDWEAALLLADEIERAFGYKGEADRLRLEIRNRQGETTRKAIAEAVASIDKHTRAEQWNQALREAEKLITIFPDNEQVRGLPGEIDGRRQAHKRQLITEWNEAVARHDVDSSIEILKRLDPYLTPAEAEGMQETARGVFKEKLNNLSAQFSNSVRDHRFAEAVRVGEAIVRDFPNSRIAQEIRENLEHLRQRSGEPAAAHA